MGLIMRSEIFKMKIWKVIAVITIAKFCKSNIGLMVESRLVTNIGDEVELEAASQTNKHDTDALIGKEKFETNISCISSFMFR